MDLYISIKVNLAESHVITEFMPEDSCGGDVVGGPVLMPGCVFRHFHF